MVRYAEALPYGVEAADWQERINVERLRAERAERARAAMRAAGVPAILVTRPQHTRYLTGIRGPEFQPQLWYVLFFAEGEPVVFHHAGWISSYPSQAPWIREWRLARAWFSGGGGTGPEVIEEESRLFAAGIADELRARGLAGEPLATVGFDRPSLEALRAVGLTLVDGTAIMLEASKIKTADEIACLKMVYAITDAAWNKVWELARPGVNADPVAWEALKAALEAGAEEVPQSRLRSGPMSFDRAYQGSGRILQYGDTAYAGFCSL
ncbi:MAG TPA: aminopeptidase P family N-terminal domain-containing protein, partial [Candidatus Limnocylindrales bacterium]|nr:aminopeptidase P family N-terminal domain-containing protein [Candidatus Limnocylindrales bacterium]